MSVSDGPARSTAIESGTPADAFFRQMVGGMRNGVLAITRAGEIALLNEEGYRIFGVPPNRGDIGKSVSEVLAGQPDVVRLLFSAWDLHMLPNRAEMRVRPHNKVIGYTLALVRDDAGSAIGLAMFFKDLTRVEQLEERERLRDRLAAVGQMAAAIAHEVKNPLAGIEVMAGLLRRKMTEHPEAQSVLSDIIKEAKMANGIVQEVLEFVRPIRLQVEPTGIAQAVQAAMQLTDSKTPGSQLDVIVRVPRELPPIQADIHQLTQLFTNLLLNANEAMEGRGQVVVTASSFRQDIGGEGRDAVRVEIQDNGPGMPEDVASHVFDPFFTTKPQGSGLGLAIVRKIVDAHDGQIDLRTAPGAGTLIRLTLPVNPGAALA